MKARDSVEEKISALVDGEINYRSIESTLAAVNSRDVVNAWDVYHHIGDVLRSDENAGKSSDAFMQRFKLRLDAELPHGQPARVVVDIPNLRPNNRALTFRPSFFALLFSRRFAMPGAAALIAAIIAFVNAPLLITANKAEESLSTEVTASPTGILKAGNDATAVAVRLDQSATLPVVVTESETVLQNSHVSKLPLDKNHLSAPVFNNNSDAGEGKATPILQR